MDRMRARVVIAAEVRAEAARRELSQKDVARLLGISQQTVSRKWRGLNPYDADEVMALAAAWDVPVTRLLCAVRDLNPEPAD